MYSILIVFLLQMMSFFKIEVFFLRTIEAIKTKKNLELVAFEMFNNHYCLIMFIIKTRIFLSIYFE